MYIVIILLALVSCFSAASTSVSYLNKSILTTVEGQRYKSGVLYKSPNNKRTLHIATLNWPPYISDSLCNKGWVYHFAVALLNSRGYDVYIEFLPWARAVRNVEIGKADILMPEYFIEDTAPSDFVENKTRRELLGISNTFKGGNIAFLKRKNSPGIFTGNLNSLKGAKIGVVRGYQNTPEFDAMMDNNEFSVIGAVDDLQLVQLLAAERVDLIIGDPVVLAHSVKYSTLNDNAKSKLLNFIEQDGKPLRYNPLYFAISKQTPNWREVLEDINQALYHFNNSGETKRLIDVISAECPSTSLN
ncbi:substrate-binding periplasmic protein [Pseudoalteromonas sp. H71]|uniref:substrate-binding periplasmic protein n=1 Tax=Pseudoalteromonas sp. H71 TaxID=1348395 RepID=UPI0007306B8B|nr:transporter substrate-binding domain-containing protein [Pseudoalteromonas sp. H71]KTD91809.1 amino acid ABC transporter substrate-binding protein [Pseudoalteromonas sp. H71]